MKPSIKNKSSKQLPLPAHPEQDNLAKRFPGLAIPNKPAINDSDEEPKDIKPTSDSIVDDMMAELEGLAPLGPSDVKKDGKLKEKRRSRSRDKRKRSRSRSKDRKRRSSSRSKDRKRRSRSRDRKNRSRSRERRRSRSRDRR